MKYSLGLDIGTTSIGWAVIDDDKKRIHDVGVRIFEKPEDPKTGQSLATPRRTARSTRRRLKRRRERLDALKKFFVEKGLLSAEQISKLLEPTNNKNPYEIRVRAAHDQVDNEDLFIALYHIAKRRGYKSNRKALEEKDTDGSRVLSAISDNRQILESLHTKSVAEALTKHEKFAQHKRNKSDDYSNSFVRQNYLDEVRQILETQDVFSSEDVERLLFGDESAGDFSGIFSQRPFMTRELINKMRGKCELEKNEVTGERELRAPQASYSFELFRMAQNLAHLRISVHSELRGLTSAEIAQVIEKAKTAKELKYKHVREVLGYKNDPEFSFAPGSIRGKIKSDDKTNGEENKFGDMPFHYSLVRVFKPWPEEWDKIKDNRALLDDIGLALTINKDDLNLRRALSELGLPYKIVDELLKLSYSQFGHLSLKALNKITPYLLESQTYDKALVSAGYVFAQKLSGEKDRLPPLSKEAAEQLTNPVAKRAISQVIKVINAVIRKYGAPNMIKIEAAGDLAKNFSDRQKILREQQENAEYNEKLKQRLVGEFGVINPTGLQITKFKLYNQQNGKCAYSGRAFELAQLFGDEQYGEIDHIVPFSRCGNDGLNNKVLVHTVENQNKRNLTPYEAWGGDENRWQEFEKLVEGLPLPRNKKLRLLAKTPPNEEWNVRALNDTRYISRFLRQYIRDNLKFAEIPGETGKQRVITPTGAITSYLRRVWRVGGKVREDNNLHHATDACIIAAISQGTIHKVSRLNKYYELFRGNQEDEITDPVSKQVLRRNQLEHHSDEVEPWEDFGKEVRIRTGQYNTDDEMRNELRGLETYDKDEEFRLSRKRIFVSRMPKRKGRAKANADTLRSPKIVEGYENSKGEPVIARKQRVSLKSLTQEMLDDSPIKETDRALYDVLTKRLAEFGGNPEKAFTEPVYKPTKDGNRVNIIRGVKVYDVKNSKSGIYINNGKSFVNNAKGSMVRLDIYSKTNAKGKNEHFFVPVYVYQIGTKKPVPTKIMPQPKGFTDVDETFTKVCTLFPNDYVRIYLGNRIEEGYYVTYDSASGRIKLISHEVSNKDAQNLLRIAARSASSIERYDINILGDNAPEM